MGEVRFMISEAAKKVQVESHVLRYWEEELHIPIGRTEMGHRYYTQDDIQLFCCIKKLKNEGMLLRDLKPLIPELKSTRQRLKQLEDQANPKPNTELNAEARDNSPRTGTESIPRTIFVTRSAATPAGAASANAKQTFSNEANPTGNSAASTNSVQSADPGSTASVHQKTAKTIPSSVQTTDTKNTTPSTHAADTKSSTASALPSSVNSTSPAEVITETQLEQVRSLIGDVLTEVVTENNQTLKKDISKQVTTDVMREMDFLFQAKERQDEEHFRKLDTLIRQQQANRRDAGKNSALFKLKKMLT